MKCEMIFQFIDDYIEGSLDSSESRLLDAHLDECDACRAELDLHQLYVRRLQGFEIAAPELGRLAEMIRQTPQMTENTANRVLEDSSGVVSADTQYGDLRAPSDGHGQNQGLTAPGAVTEASDAAALTGRAENHTTAGTVRPGLVAIVGQFFQVRRQFVAGFAVASVLALTVSLLMQQQFVRPAADNNALAEGKDIVAGEQEGLLAASAPTTVTHSTAVPVVHNIQVLINVPQDMAAADLSLHFPDALRLQGLEDMAIVAWPVNLKRGANVLSLPVTFVGTAESQQELSIAASVRYGNKTKHFQLNVVTPKDASRRGASLESDLKDGQMLAG